MIAELSLALWLLVKGVDEEQWADTSIPAQSLWLWTDDIETPAEAQEAEAGQGWVPRNDLTDNTLNSEVVGIGSTDGEKCSAGAVNVTIRPVVVIEIARVSTFWRCL